jgi:hypothetical protein
LQPVHVGAGAFLPCLTVQPYLAGDGAVQAPDGYFRILGRVDDVINVWLQARPVPVVSGAGQAVGSAGSDGAVRQMT